MMRPGAALLALLLILGGCRRVTTPRQQVEALIARAVKAAEHKDVGALGEMISERFAGDYEDLDKSAVSALLRLQFRRYPTIYVITDIRSLTFPETGKAEAKVFTATASVPLSREGLRDVAADFLVFDLVLVEEKPRDWKVVSAHWSGAAGTAPE